MDARRTTGTRTAAIITKWEHEESSSPALIVLSSACVLPFL